MQLLALKNIRKERKKYNKLHSSCSLAEPTRSSEAPGVSWAGGRESVAPSGPWSASRSRLLPGAVLGWHLPHSWLFRRRGPALQQLPVLWHPLPRWRISNQQRDDTGRKGREGRPGQRSQRPQLAAVRRRPREAGASMRRTRVQAPWPQDTSQLPRQKQKPVSPKAGGRTCRGVGSLCRAAAS